MMQTCLLGNPPTCHLFGCAHPLLHAGPRAQPLLAQRKPELADQVFEEHPQFAMSLSSICLPSMFFTFQRRVSQIAGAFHSGEHSPAQLRSFLQVGQSSVIVTPVLSLLKRLTKVRGGAIK